MGDNEDTTLKGLESLYKAMKLEVDDLYETVYKGNGKPSLVTRVNSVEGKLRGMREQVEEKFTHLDTQHALKFDSLHQKLENKFARLEGVLEQRFSNMEDVVKDLVEVKKIDRTGSWQFKAALITAGAALAATLISFFLKS